MGKLSARLLRPLKWLFLICFYILMLGLLLSYLSPYVSPKTAWWIQLFGLAYPIILLITVILAIGFLFNSRKKALILWIVILIGTPVHLRFFGTGVSQDKSIENANTVRVMSYNVRLFDMYKWVHDDLADSKKAFLNYFKAQAPDVLCLQEYIEDNRPTPHISINEIKKAGGFSHLMQTLTVQSKNVNFGLAIYSKYPIIHQGELKTSDSNMSCIYVDIVKNDDTIRIYNTHLQSIRFQQDEYSIFDENAPTSKSSSEKVYGLFSKLKSAYPQRIDETKDILEHAKETDLPIIIAGDFNEPPLSYIYGQFNDYFNDAFRETSFGIGKTYAGKIPAGRIDYIFYNDRLNALSFQRQREIISDHYAIGSELEILK
jgi:vancomycin resistance protein VanJ